MMKKILFFLLLAVFTLGISAQGPSKKCPVCGLSIPKCQYKGKHPKKKPTPTALARQQPSKPAKRPTKPVKQPAKPVNQPAEPTPVPTPTRPTTGTLNGYEWVDLGLSVKWATQNVGAASPSDYRDYFAWGETRPKSSYTWNNCFDCLDSTGDSWGTYKIGGETSISPTSGHDAARENWGSMWRMPTITEFKELCYKCDWTWTSQGGHNGYLVTSKTNGNSIFLPAAGCRSGSFRYYVYYVGERGYYWSSTLCSSYSYRARYLYFFSGYHGTSDSNRRCEGHSVRPVTE